MLKFVNIAFPINNNTFRRVSRTLVVGEGSGGKSNKRGSGKECYWVELLQKLIRRGKFILDSRAYVFLCN